MKNFLTFLNIAGNLKNIPRTGPLVFAGIKTCTIPEHTFLVSLISASLMDDFRAEGHKIDGEKVLKVAISHDLAESVLGDIPTSSPSYASFFEEDIKEVYKKAEKKVMEEILELVENRAPFVKEDELSKPEKDLFLISDIVAILVEILDVKFQIQHEWLDAFWNNTIKRLQDFSSYKFVLELIEVFGEEFKKPKKSSNPLLTQKKFNEPRK